MTRPTPAQHRALKLLVSGVLVKRHRNTDGKEYVEFDMPDAPRLAASTFTAMKCAGWIQMIASGADAVMLDHWWQLWRVTQLGREAEKMK